MTGQNLYDQLTSVLNGEAIDQAFALQLFNLARTDFEGRRPFTALKAVDATQVAAAGYNPNTPYAMPSPATPSLTSPSLTQYLLEGAVRLVGVANANSKASLREIPFENQLDFQQGSFFWADYANRVFHILANLPSAFTIYQFFIADYGDITLTSTWNGFPARFHPALVFQAAARYRLGTDYDDISARNADDNSKLAEATFRAMVTWDERIARQQAQNLPHSATDGGSAAGGYAFPGSYNPYGG